MTDTPAPVKVSDEAHRGLTAHIQRWSGLATSTLVLGPPKVSPFASFSRAESLFTANPDRLVLNPNRVYLTLTPFRLRQEAVMTGALLHEASHARHTRWTPTNEAELKALVHSDGEPVSRQTLAFAKLLEEPRIEGIMSVECDGIGAYGLNWTMRASAAHLIPSTGTLGREPGQRIMDLITSWVLRAGRQLSIQHNLSEVGTAYNLPTWVGDFNSLLHDELTKHKVVGTDGNEKMLGPIGANVVKRALTNMACAGADADTGTWMVDEARDILRTLFPETTGDEDNAPMPGDPMHNEEGDEAGDKSESMPGEGDPDQGSEGEDSEGEGEGDGDGTSDAPGSGESDGQGSGEGEGQGEDGKPGEGQQGGESAGPGEPDPTAVMLASLEAEADDKTEAECDAKAAEAPPVQPDVSIGAGEGHADIKGDWRSPTPDERGVARDAAEFLRSLISPSEVSKTSLSEAPSASVDGQALAIFKAGGQSTAPQFFRRTRREVSMSPPVRIAVLVDVSYSMSPLQAPSALLSWALASGAVDLRNFAGRGVQVESCLIHWGTEARVVQANGKPLPGIRTVACNSGTTAMGEAMDLVAEEMPGFFDETDKPTNRLLVQFTDWQLSGWAMGRATGRATGYSTVQDYMNRGLAAGVNMLTVAPGPLGRASSHNHFVSKAPVQRGRTSVLVYNERMFVGPADVWAEAKRLLA